MLKTFWTLGQTVPAARESLVDHSGIAAADFAAAVTAPPAALDERFVDAFSVTGTTDECRGRIAAYAKAGVTDLVLTFVGRPDRRHGATFARAKVRAKAD